MTGILISWGFMGIFSPLRTWVEFPIHYYLEIMGVQTPPSVHATQHLAPLDHCCCYVATDLPDGWWAGGTSRKTVEGKWNFHGTNVAIHLVSILWNTSNTTPPTKSWKHTSQNLHGRATTLEDSNSHDLVIFREHSPARCHSQNTPTLMVGNHPFHLVPSICSGTMFSLWCPFVASN